MTVSADFDAWKEEALARDIKEVADGFGAKLQRSGHEWVGPCCVCGGTDRFSIDPKKRIFNCRKGGKGGDVIALTQYVMGCDFVQAVQELTGRPPPGRDALPATEEEKAARARRRAENEARQREDQERRQAQDAKQRSAAKTQSEKIFAACEPIMGTHAAAYLAGRGITLAGGMGVDLRFAKSMKYSGYRNPEGGAPPEDDVKVELGPFPGMVAAFRVDGEIVGLHRTYLKVDRPEKIHQTARNPAKKMTGKKTAADGRRALIWLTAPAPHLIIGEGIESTLSAYVMGVGGGEAAAATAGDLGNMCGLATGTVPHPCPFGEDAATILNGIPDPADPGLALPAEVKEVTLVGDGDSDPPSTVAKLLTGARRLAAQGKIVFVVMPPRGKDMNNLLMEAVKAGDAEPTPPAAMTLAEFERYAGFVMAGWLDGKPVRPKGKFNTITIDEVNDIAAREHAWLINDLIPRYEISYLVGKSGSGKSFLGLDMGLAIARGLPFFGNWTRQGGVLYVAGEGGIGAKKRLYGYKKHHDFHEAAPFMMVPEKLNIYRKDGDTGDLIAEAKEWDRYWRAVFGVPLEVIFIDTLAKSMDGADEISGKDMGLVMAAVDRIRKEVGCAVVLVHHLNASGGRERGHTSMLAGIETSIWITVDEHKVRTVTASKQKDGEGGDLFKFELMSVQVGTREEDGKPITTCIVVPKGRKAELRGSSAGPGFKLRPAEQIFMRALFDAAKTKGIKATDEHIALGIPAGAEVVHYTDWRDMYASVAAPGVEGEAPDQKAIASVFRSLMTSLTRFSVIGWKRPWLWHTGKGLRDFPHTLPKEAKPQQQDPPPHDGAPPIESYPDGADAAGDDLPF